MGKRKTTTGPSSSSKRRPSRPATTSPTNPLPSRRSSRRSTFEEPCDAVPLAYWEPPLPLPAATAANFGNRPLVCVPRVSPPPSPTVPPPSPPSPPMTPPSPFTYSPPSSPLPHSAPPLVEPTSPPPSTPAPVSPPPPPSSSVNKGKRPATTPPPLRRSRRHAPYSASPSAQPTSSDDSAPDPVVPISAVDAYTSRFFLRANQIRWRLVSRRPLVSERPLGPSFDAFGISDLLRSAGILATVTRFSHFESQVIHDFYANLTRGVSDSRSSFYERVYVSNRIYEFNPTRIASLFDLSTVGTVAPTVADSDLISTLTGGKLCTWPLKTTDLTMKYRILFGIGTTNWFPTAHHGTLNRRRGLLLYCIGSGIPCDLAQFIFEEIVAEADSKSTAYSLPFPSLIYRLLIDQGYVPNRKNAVPSLPLPLSISSKIVDPHSDSRRVPRVDDLPCRPSPTSGCHSAPSATAPILSDVISLLSAEYKATLARADELKTKIDYYTALAQKGGDTSGGAGHEAAHQEISRSGGVAAAAGSDDPTVAPTVPTVGGATAEADTDDGEELFVDAEDILD